MESIEWYFFKWAYPCMYVLVQMGSMTKERLDELDKMYANGVAPSRKELEETNVAAFRRLNELAKELNEDVWSWEVMRKYWEAEDHNRFIDNRDGNYSKFDDNFCEMCKVHSGRVSNIESKPEGIILELETINGKQKFVQGKFLDAKKGELVLTHLAYAVQKA